MLLGLRRPNATVGMFKQNRIIHIETCCFDGYDIVLMEKEDLRYGNRRH